VKLKDWDELGSSRSLGLQSRVEIYCRIYWRRRG